MRRRPLLPWLLSAGLALALFSVVGHRASSDHEANAAPVLQRLRNLGDLHTARFEYADVVDHGSYQAPEGMLAALPGADALARATTGNKALVDVRGSVEAGVDLRRLQAISTPAGLQITLPLPQMYAPEVDAHLFSVRHGLLWNDDEIALGAVAEAKGRLAQAARRQGLLDNARQQAQVRVRALAETFGAKVSEVRFGQTRA